MNRFIIIIQHRNRTTVMLTDDFQYAYKLADEKLQEIRYLYPYDMIQVDIYKATLAYNRVDR